jgi:hypothetical protein
MVKNCEYENQRAQLDDCVIARSECNITPWNVYKIIAVISKKVECRQFRVAIRGDGPSALQDMDATILLPKASLVKACVLHDPESKILYYSGNYPTSKLLLSRFHWLYEHSSLSFCDFSVKNIYKAIVSSSPHKVTHIERWEKALGIP